ncbi:MAG TPA: type II toxin-antitoxin system HicA family toxin [Firmicutes bacterium]|nr:type II toxin-antitoxin system HicA family toxin [Bacillota bacterium]
MSQIAKLLEKLKRKPTPSDIPFSDVDRLLRAYGFVQRQPAGGSSHFTYTHPELTDFILTIARHGGKVKKGYVRKTVEAIERVRELYGGDLE